MEKTLKQVMKDPKRHERVKKLLETYMRKLKEKIIRDNQPSLSSSKDRSTPSTSSTDNSTSFSTVKSMTRSCNNYIYGVVLVFLLAMGVCAFFTYKKKSFQIANKEQVKKQPIKPPKQLSMLN